AILVLFLFVIMLLNLRPNSEFGEPMPPLTIFTKVAIPLLLVVELLLIINRISLGSVPSGLMREVSDTFGSVPTVARLLFTDYMYPFQLTGVLLLVAIVGAVVISRKEDSDSEPPAANDVTDSQTTEEVAG
ncbi:MAG: NADH-quinone oxidoreductase subunit J, partial [candidate division Zixibacteria bacterium]